MKSLKAQIKQHCPNIQFGVNRERCAVGSSLMEYQIQCPANQYQVSFACYKSPAVYDPCDETDPFVVKTEERTFEKRNLYYITREMIGDNRFPSFKTVYVKLWTRTK